MKILRALSKFATYVIFGYRTEKLYYNAEEIADRCAGEYRNTRADVSLRDLRDNEKYQRDNAYHHHVIDGRGKRN